MFISNALHILNTETTISMIVGGTVPLVVFIIIVTVIVLAVVIYCKRRKGLYSLNLPGYTLTIRYGFRPIVSSLERC